MTKTEKRVRDDILDMDLGNAYAVRRFNEGFGCSEYIVLKNGEYYGWTLHADKAAKFVLLNDAASWAAGWEESVVSAFPRQWTIFD